MAQKIFTLLFVIAWVTGATAQLQFEGQQDVYYGSVSVEGEEVDVAWDVINATDQTLELSCSRQALQEVPFTDGNFCWGLLCIPWSSGNYNASSEVAIMEPGETNHSFKAKYRHHGNAGQSIYRYCIYEVNGLVPNVCHIVNYCVDAECLVSTNDISMPAGSISIFPNPIEKVGNITYQFKNAPSKGKMAVYNMMGSKVKEIAINNREGIIFLGASDFAPGVYFCSLEDNGVVHQTVRMVIQ